MGESGRWLAAVGDSEARDQADQVPRPVAELSWLNDSATTIWQ